MRDDLSTELPQKTRQQ